ncbi:MAG TPA: oxidoreductase [Polyangiaceae bacterium]|nr:oxidoreductase [Polyangiaceae bacterium]
MKTAWIAGGSGLVGAQLLSLLLDDSEFGMVVSLGRKRLEVESPKLVQRTVDFSALDMAGLAAPEVAFCSLGTTIGKAGSQQAFRAVDHDAVLAFARAALAAGARCFVLVSSLGADARSRIFYNRVKGETEADLRALGFASLPIAQPSLLLGDRVESRPAERAMIVASRFLGAALKPFAARPIEARVVAKALLAIAHDPPSGPRTYPSAELQRLGGG